MIGRAQPQRPPSSAPVYECVACGCRAPLERFARHLIPQPQVAGVPLLLFPGFTWGSAAPQYLLACAGEGSCREFAAGIVYWLRRRVAG